MKHVLAIDQGTTSSRAILYNENLEVISVGQQTFPQHFPRPEWVEHDLNEIWASVEGAISTCLKGFSGEISAIGITNQRETFGLWEKSSGAPLGPAIVWQCRRSAAICQKLKKSAAGKKLPALTGLVLDPYFSGTKLKWRFDEDKTLLKRAKSGEIAFGTIDTFLIWKLSGGQSHVTDVSNASRTLLMDLKKGQWSDFCLKTLGIPRAVLPEIKDSNAHFGSTKGLAYLKDGIPICGVLGDQQAALFGQGCFKPGEAKITYGTGAFFLVNTGSAPKKTKNGVSTVAWGIDGKLSYALEGSVFIAGAAVSWLRDGLNIMEKSSDIESLAGSVPNSDGVFFIPALAGLGAPQWAPEAKGLIGGLTRRSTKAHLALACLEGVAHQIADSFGGLVKDSGTKLKKLCVDGGASKNRILLQTQANLLQSKVQRPKDVESTARGAALMAAWSAGMIPKEKLSELHSIDVEILPTAKKNEVKREREVWARRIKALISGAY